MENTVLILIVMLTLPVANAIAKILILQSFCPWFNVVKSYFTDTKSTPNDNNDHTQQRHKKV